MPTYDYKCTSCENRFEHFQSMMEETLKICKECGAELKRLIGSGSSPIFKGSGFYQTDYKKSSSSNSESTSATSVKTEIKKPA